MQRHCELLAAAHRRRRLPHHAGEVPVRARRRTRAAPRHGAGQPLGRAGRGARHQHRRARARSNGACSRPSSASSRRTRCASSRGARAPRKRACAYDEFLRVARGLSERRRDRSLLDVPRAREAVGRRRARDALQRAVPLARAARDARSRRAARWDATTSSRMRTGARAAPSSPNVNIMAVAHGTEKADGARAQGGDRPAPRGGGHPRHATPTCSGAGAARSSRPRCCPEEYEAWCRRTGDRSRRHARALSAVVTLGPRVARRRTRCASS